MSQDNTPYYPVAGELITETAVETLAPAGKSSGETVFLFVHAHPDDESSSTGATMGALAKAGAQVHLLTMTRGEMGEVIDRSLAHLEAENPANTDGGVALGKLRTAELKQALAALGITQHTFLGEGDAKTTRTPPLYRDSGMTWGEDGRAAPNPLAAPDCLTRSSLELQAEAIAALIEQVRPDVLVTYDADGGYGHPDHKRTYEATQAAVELLKGSDAAPTLFWGIEGEADATDTRQQAVITGDLVRKRDAMAAHATQITITGDTTFEYSNGVPQPISAIETYRLLGGEIEGIKPAPPTAHQNSSETQEEPPGVINSLITSIAIGLLVGFSGTIYHSWIWYINQDLWVPWGALLGCLTVFFAATWATLHTRKNWTAALVGFTAFTLISIFAYAKGNSMLVYINPINPPGIAGTLWAMGSLVAATLSLIATTRYRLKRG